MRGSFWAAIGTVAVLGAVGTFVGVRALSAGSGAVQHTVQTGAAQAQAPQGNSTPFADAPGTDEVAKQAFAADLAQPRFTGTLAGVRFEGGAVRGADYDCGTNPVLHPDFSVALGTRLDIFAGGLPAGLSAAATGTAGADKPYAASCGGVLMATDRNLLISTSAGLQLVTVGRLLTPEAWTTSNFPATRATAGTIEGRPAVLVRSIMPDGRGGSYVIWADRAGTDYVLTVVYGGNASLSDIRVRFKVLRKCISGVTIREDGGSEGHKRWKRRGGSFRNGR